MNSQPHSNPPVIGQILLAYGIAYDHVLHPQGGYRNKAYPVMQAGVPVANLILYKSEPGILAKIRSANLVSNYFATQGFPTRQTISPKIITLRSATRVKYGALYNYLPGETIPWEGYTQKHLKLVGLTLGQMHASLATQDYSATLPRVTDEYAQITSRMQSYFAQSDAQEALLEKLGLELDPNAISRYQKLLTHCATLPGQQPLHMDFVRSNILFGSSGPLQLDNVAITGILDFEKTAWGHPLFDVARTLAFLLVDCKYKSETKIRKYFLHSGYSKRGQGRVNAKLLEPLLDLFLTYDFYKFLRHNPYDYLPSNEHFVRTCDILAQRGLLKIAATVAKPVL
jgi:Ser/Thr protein kinase RdoA (MazF antagonist)